MSVQVVGMVIARELSALLNQNGSDALQKMFESGPSHQPVSCIGGIVLEESDSEDNMVGTGHGPYVSLCVLYCVGRVVFWVQVHWHSDWIFHVFMFSPGQWRLRRQCQCRQGTPVQRSRAGQLGIQL